MSSFLPRVILGVVLVLALRWTTAAAQPAPAAVTNAGDPQTIAKQLTNEAIAAQDAKDYSTAVVLYKRAYAQAPHPILIFDVAQAYMLAGDLVQAEKFYLRYLELDPKGRGVPAARKFLTSRSAAAAPQPAPPPSPPAMTTSASPRGIDNAETGERPQDGQLTAGLPRPRDSAGSGGALVAAPGQASAPSREAPLLRARHFKIAGGTVMGVGVALAAATLAYGSPNESKLVLGASSAAVLLTFVGVGIFAYGEKQQRSAQQVAWSPVLGPGFAGVAWSGRLP